MTPKDFAHYEENDLIRTYQFFQNQKIIAFTDLPQTRPLTTHDFFRYLQIKNLLDTPTYKQAGNTPLTIFEQACIHAPIQKSQISTTYELLLKPIGTHPPG
ncbi:Hypothetical predicted protein, partial [Pelobates cultripes]